MIKVILSFLVGFVLAAGLCVGAYFKYEQMQVAHMPTGEPTPRPTGEGWIDLFDKDHEGQWKNVDDDTKIFELKDGSFHVFPIGPMRQIGYLGEEFGDFELHVEFKVAKGTQRRDLRRRNADVQHGKAGGRMELLRYHLQGHERAGGGEQLESARRRSLKADHACR